MSSKETVIRLSLDMSKRYSGKSFKDSSTAKNLFLNYISILEHKDPKLSLKEKRKNKNFFGLRNLKNLRL